MHDFTRSTSHPLMILQKKCSNQACKLRLFDEEDLKGMKWIDSESESNNEDIGSKNKCLDTRMMDTYMDT